MSPAVPNEQPVPDLKRIDDFVKLLVGLVVGQFLRDVHLIRDGLRIVTKGSVLAEVFPYLFIALVVRNVHASFRYDAWSTARKFSAQFESTVKGRATTFIFGILALFVSTYAVEHFLASHFVITTDKNVTVPPDAVSQIWVLVLFLVIPFAVYAVWDAILWLQTDSPTVKKDKVMQHFIREWLVIDTVGWVWLLICLAYYKWGGTHPDGGFKLTLVTFSVLAVGTVAADYWRNVSFYFSEIKPNKTLTTVAPHVA